MSNAAAQSEPVRYIERTRSLYSSQKPYRWVVNDASTDPPPWTPIDLPLSDQRVAVIGSGGVHLTGQEPFHFRNDASVREIPIDAKRSDLRVAHFGYDIRDAQRDPACVLPLRALRELEAGGEIASVVDPAISFMGGIYSARMVRDDLAPRLRDFVLRERASLVLLVPV